MKTGFLIPLIIVALPFIFTLAIIIIKSRENKSKTKYKAELYAKAIEKGEKLPDILWEDPQKKNNALQSGILLLSVGIGLAVFLGVALEPSEKLRGAVTGVIPFSLGIGFLIIHFTTKKRR